MIRAILFDLDGVLVDAADWHFRSLNRALSVFGHCISRREHLSLYNGLPTAVKLELLSQRKKLPRALHPFINQLKQTYTRQTVLSSCSADIKVSAMLRHLKAQGYKLGVATNAIRSTLELMLDKMAVRSYFDIILSNEDISRPKPDPEIYLHMMKMLKVSPEQCLIIEDSIPGIQAARASQAHLFIVTGTEEVALDRLLEQITRINLEDRKNQTDQIEQKPQIDDKVLEIVIPMAGLGQRFLAAGYKLPKPLIDIAGKPMIQWVIENIMPRSQKAHFTFLCNKQHSEDYDLPVLLNRLAPGCSIVEVAGATEGAACTVILAIEHIDLESPLLLVNSDQWIEASIDDFLTLAKKENIDGMIMTFWDNDKKWSYAKVDSSGKVVQVAEKDPISNHATVGVYYYRNAGDFISAAMDMIRKDTRTNGEFYVCPVYNELISQNKHIRIHEINPSAMQGLGTPEDLERFIQRQPYPSSSEISLFPNNPV